MDGAAQRRGSGTARSGGRNQPLAGSRQRETRAWNKGWKMKSPTRLRTRGFSTAKLKVQPWGGGQGCCGSCFLGLISRVLVLTTAITAQSGLRLQHLKIQASPAINPKKITSQSGRTPWYRESQWDKNQVKCKFYYYYYIYFFFPDEARLPKEDVYTNPCFANQGLAAPCVTLQLLFTADI